MTLRYRLALLASTFAIAPMALAQSGKISGRVTDARNGDELPGVNIVVDGTSLGAVSDVDGYFTIIGIRPGTYTVRATYIGYAPKATQNVRVNLDQTTPLNITMSEEDVSGTEVEVVAEAQRPVVEADVSSSRANITAEQIQSTTANSVAGVVGLQAGSEGLSIRGSGSDELSFNVNGLTLRDERNNAPYTAIPLASVEEVQVVSGGFNAEYGNVRSGLINVITKEGSRSRYNADVSLRYAPPQLKNFDQSPNDPNSYWIRPLIDPAVAFVGTTNGTWDAATQAQYRSFEGWISVSEKLLANSNPNDDMTPQALYEAFRYQHRKTFTIDQPDYNVDLGFGGPVPGLNRFGDTRFYASFRRDQSMYFIPLSEDRYLQQTGHVKVTSDVSRGMKLTLEGLYGQVTGTASSRIGQPGVYASAGGIASDLNQTTYTDARIFASDYWNPTRTRDFMLGGTFTHAVSNSTFYEVRATRYASFYDTNPGPARDTTAVVSFGGVGFDEAPFGFVVNPSNGVDGMRMGVGFSTARDTSRVVAYNLKGDLTHQFNRFLEGKTGFEFNLTDSRVNYGQFDAYLRSSNFTSKWDRTPTRGALYAQTKLEFRGMVANTGLRLDYSHAGGQWYDYTPFSPLLSNVTLLDTTAQSNTKRIVTLSPRLGVSFPVTTTSKLYFNYGHFRSLPSPDDLYLVRFYDENRRVTRIADPNEPLPKTVAYEIGYEQSFFDQFLVRTAGYYKNVSLEGLLVSYTNRNGSVTYSRSEPNGYADIRGFEFTIERKRGRWFRGFANYTYMVTSSGRFGRVGIYENTSTQRERDVSENAARNLQSKPLPAPYARLSLDFFTPSSFGPLAGGLRPLADWHLIALGTWRAGSYYTWAGGGGAPENVSRNLQYRSSKGLDLRITRDFRFGPRRVSVFADINNVLNIRRLSMVGFSDGNDFTAYMRSLHLPKAQKGEYTTIVGDDTIGDFRLPDVAYDPIIHFADRTAYTSAVEGTLYFERNSETYLQYSNGAWQPADQARVNQVLRDKAYIDMPNQTFLNFFNPRTVYLGLRVNF